MDSKFFQFLVNALAILLMMGSGCSKEVGINDYLVNSRKLMDDTSSKGSLLDIAVPGDFLGGSESSSNALETFELSDKIVMTYYFYWYDVNSGAHIFNGDGSDALTDHPASMDDFSYTSIRWHKQQLKDMIEAGIDVVLPVYWGTTKDLNWSNTGIKRLVEAWSQLKQEGYNPPRIGLFYDTTPLRSEDVLKKGDVPTDLTSLLGKQFFYKMMRDFYSMVPTEMRARIDGRPIVQLYSANFASNHDQSTFDFAIDHFKSDFGGEGPFIIKEISWNNAQADDEYTWGAALNGLKNTKGVIAIGPGYDDSAVPGRTTPKRSRENGNFYSNSWKDALFIASKDSTKHIVVIETWNEFHEGTDIANSVEYGYQYIDTTSKYSQLFKEGKVVLSESQKFAEADSVFITFDNGAIDKNGIDFKESQGDGTFEYIDFMGIPCLKSLPATQGGEYLYFSVNEFFVDGMNYKVTIEFFDNGNNISMAMDYDSFDSGATLNGAYTRTPNFIIMSGTNNWKKASITLNNARFEKRENGGSDFRIAVSDFDLIIRRITVEKI